jgi:hypothetical protein
MFSKDPKEAYKQFMGAASAALAPDEFWCVVNDEGVFEGHASKDMGEAVRSFCDALDIDWDEATEAGCRIAVVKMNAQTEAVP